MVVQNQLKIGKGSAIPTDPHHTPTFIQPSPQPQKTQKPRKPIKDTQVPQPSDLTESVADESDPIGTATPNESSSLGTTSCGGPRGNTLQSDEDRLKLNELMELCTTLQQRVLDLEKTNTTQHNEIVSLKRRVKKLGKKDRSRTHKLKRLYKVDEEITIVSVQDDADKEMFDVDDLNGEEVFVIGWNENVVEVVDAAQVSIAAITVTITTKEITLAQALEALKLQNLRREEEQTTNPSSIKKNHVYLPEEYGRKEAQDLKNKSFNSIKKMFDRAFKKVNTFVDFITNLVKELQSLMEVIPDEEDVAIDVVPLATKSPKIVDWKIPQRRKEKLLLNKAARQCISRQEPRSSEYVPENHIPVYIPEPEHPEDLVPAEDEAPIPPLPPSFLSPPVRAEVEVLRRERLAYEQEGMETRQALAKSEAHCRALEARVTVLETEARRHEWQRQAAISLVVHNHAYTGRRLEHALTTL
ncbi:hypothetical protein Tco_0277273 [Tanacetum coccineum]